jgi:uncharacterized protein YukE
MSSVRIDYDELKDAWKAADKAASGCESYAKEITKKVTNKIDSFTGGSNSYTSNAASYASGKVRELNNKANTYRSLSSQLQTLHTEAKNTDKDVKGYLRLAGRAFRDSHNMHVSRVTEMFVDFFISVSNVNPVSQWIKDSFRSAGEWLDDAWHDVKYWYNCEGGKYVIKIVAAVVIAVVAVVALIAAWPVMVAAIAAGAVWASIAAVAGVIGAAIGLADAIVDLVYNITALSTFGSDPAWAARYDSYDSLAGWLKKNRFESSWVNKWSYTASTIVSVVKVSCAVINIINMAKNSIKFIKGLKSGTNWLKTKGVLNVLKRSDASMWTKAKYLVKSLSVDYKTVTSATKLNQFKQYLESTDSFCKTLKGFTDATKGLKTLSKFVINLDEKGGIKAVTDYFKGKTTYIKELNSDWKSLTKTIESFKDSIEAYQKIHAYHSAA